MQDELPLRFQNSANVVKELLSILPPFDHPEGAEHANYMVNGIRLQRVKFHQVGLKRVDPSRSGRFVGNELLVVEIVNQAIEHGLRQIDGEHTVATFCQRDNVPPGSAAKVRHDQLLEPAEATFGFIAGRKRSSILWSVTCNGVSARN